MKLNKFSLALVLGIAAGCTSLTGQPQKKAENELVRPSIYSVLAEVPKNQKTYKNIPTEYLVPRHDDVSINQQILGQDYGPLNFQEDGLLVTGLFLYPLNLNIDDILLEDPVPKPYSTYVFHTNYEEETDIKQIKYDKTMSLGEVPGYLKNKYGNKVRNAVLGLTLKSLGVGSNPIEKYFGSTLKNIEDFIEGYVPVDEVDISRKGIEFEMDNNSIRFGKSIEMRFFKGLDIKAKCKSHYTKLEFYCSIDYKW